MEHRFVYYKLSRHEAHALVPRLRAMMRELQAATRVRTRLLHKLGESGSTTTLMETYEDIEDTAAFDAALSDALARAGLPPSAVAARRTERFGDL